MKETFKKIGITILLITLYSLVSISEMTYRMDAEIVDVDNDKITIVDIKENEWIFYGNDFEVGQKVKVTFENNHTDHNRKDDKIIKVNIIE